MDPIIIIGTGLAGYTLAKEFRALDAITPLVLITSSEGHFYSKPLLSTALTKQQHPTTLALHDAPAMARQLNATIYTQTKVIRIDRAARAVHTHEQSFTYSRLVLACGADKITPPITGNLEAVRSLCSVNNLEDYAVFREALVGKKRIAILGAGLVGCEFANDLLNTSHQVDIIALGNYPLEPLLPKEIGQVLRDALARAGATWHLKTTVHRIDKEKSGYLLTLSDDTYLETDLVLSAIGLRPHIELAKTASLTTQRGIVVDHTLQTSDPHIFALGDCAEVDGLVFQYIAPLLLSARALAKTLASETTHVQYPPMPVNVKTPSCPLTFLPPPRNTPGQWEISGEGNDWKALFYDKQHELHGFALTGEAVREKVGLVKELINQS